MSIERKPINFGNFVLCCACCCPVRLRTETLHMVGGTGCVIACASVSVVPSSVATARVFSQDLGFLIDLGIWVFSRRPWLFPRFFQRPFVFWGFQWFLTKNKEKVGLRSYQ